MSRSTDLNALLEAQRIPQDSNEMRELQRHRADVEAAIRDAFPGAVITIRYGGSKAKGTMIKESYDLDIIVYAHYEENGLGATLADIYKNVAEALSGTYMVEQKISALRLYAKENDGRGERLRIDVVPGRFVDETCGDAYIFQNGAKKCRLKTNLQVHVDHIKDSGVTDVLKLVKLMRVRHDLDAKQFGIDLLTIELLDGKKGDSLDAQFTHVLESIRDANAPIAIEDPANPSGNNLDDLLSGSVWSELRQVAGTMLDNVDASDWGSAFGEPDNIGASRIAVISHAAETVDAPTKPWAR